MRIEPRVSEPRAPRQGPAATAAPEPPLEPPVTRPVSQGLRGEGYQTLMFVPPSAHSCMLSLPIITTPACFNRSTVKASSAGTWFSTHHGQAVVRTRRSRKSLRAKGMPCSGPRRRPAASSALRPLLRRAVSNVGVEAFRMGSSASARDAGLGQLQRRHLSGD